MPDNMRTHALPALIESQKSEQQKLSTINPSDKDAFKPCQLASLLMDASYGAAMKDELEKSEKEFIENNSDKLRGLRTCGNILLAELSPLTIVPIR
ncbi:hypothetical protein [Endozoicomonas sp.]|uniref:hypothetical protein n=1 Tax=Endozoicomonas sp. TaxID=1892382 RepID=UPI002884E1BC|nr:hypothetical protein [Endozoicomonas sp.]